MPREVFDAQGKCAMGHTHFARAETEEGVIALVRNLIQECDLDAKGAAAKESQ